MSAKETIKDIAFTSQTGARELFNESSIPVRRKGTMIGPVSCKIFALAANIIVGLSNN